MRRKKNKSKQWIIIVILILIIITCVSIIGTLLLKRELTPDYAPGVIDPNAVPLPEDGEKLEPSEGGGAVSLSFSDDIAVNLESKEIKLYFQNPSKSTEDMVLQIIITKNDKDVIIGQSERIPAGYAIYKMKLLDSVKLQKGGYDGKINILYYNTQTEEKAMVNTNIPVTIAVE